MRALQGVIILVVFLSDAPMHYLGAQEIKKGENRTSSLLTSEQIQELMKSALAKKFGAVVINDYRYAIIIEGEKQGIRMESRETPSWTLDFTLEGAAVPGGKGAIPADALASGISHLRQLYEVRDITASADLRKAIPGLSRESTSRPVGPPPEVHIPVPTRIGSATGAGPSGKVSLDVILKYSDKYKGLTPEEFERLAKEERDKEKAKLAPVPNTEAAGRPWQYCFGPIVAALILAIVVNWVRKRTTTL